MFPCFYAACTHTHTHTLTHTHTHTYTHTHTDTHTPSHTHTYTHTHTHTQGIKLRKSKTTLNVFSLRTSEMKHLTKEVFGRFITDCYNQMYLTDMIKHLRNPIPIKAHFYIDFESKEPLPDYLTTELVTIENVRIKLSEYHTHTHTHTTFCDI